MYLYFDIASHTATFALASLKKVLAMKEHLGTVRDDELPDYVERLLHSAKASYSDIDHIACVTGPGGFTSLRVAVTFANVLADQLQLPLAGVHLADLYSAECTDTDVVWIHSTKKSEVFVRGVTQEADHWSWPHAVHLPLEDALKSITSSSWCGELIPEHEEAVQAKGMQKAVLTPLTDTLPTFLYQLEYAQTSIVPWYGRGW
ncbi:tRNA (adenosine(37)-N6)-threonylcarbamoyltransferase complex dimerization subunit type 1 TsaB [Candidatus Peregrinibacteria bacterium CG10_big_fil_rev_8_21_14_0_10_49_10]|nr:MAG: tRNA (adenosine(37)-N6)-threonylcarbamoyltransferase complex dimerization subunit type 1 TsaB [Candidatus Peregrinibacteria bacterium CG10_big_fil_rev_8_21_14_0_10_49_10]